MTQPQITPNTLAILKIPASVDLVASFLLLLSKHHPDCVLVPSTPENAWLTIESAPTPFK
jgi:hypothetical protein